MFKKTAIVAAAAAGLMMLGSPALAATENYDNENHIKDNSSQSGLVNIGDVLSNNCSLVNLNVGLLSGIGILGGGGDQVNSNTCVESTATNHD